MTWIERRQRAFTPEAKAAFNYVIEMLGRIFGHSPATGYQMAWEVHTTGRAVVATDGSAATVMLQMQSGATVVMTAAVVSESAVAEGSPVPPAPAADPFADTDRDWTQAEVIEVLEPTGSTWFDELEESVTPILPPKELH